MNINLVAYDSAYPGSMSPKKEGDYIERTDAASLAGALLEQIASLKRQVEDWEDAAKHGDAMQALSELVAVKDLKDHAEALLFAGPLSQFGENWEAEYKRMRAEYIRRQPKAWDAARAATGASHG